MTKTKYDKAFDEELKKFEGRISEIKGEIEGSVQGFDEVIRDFDDFDFMGFIKRQQAIVTAQGTIIELQSKLIEDMRQRISFLREIDSVQGKIHEKLLSLEVGMATYSVKKELRTNKARFAANKRHEATNTAKEELKKIWQSGKYSTRDICAEQESGHLGLSYSTARKALTNIPKNT